MAWTTLNMQVTTPLFNGGHQPPMSMAEAARQEAGGQLPAHATEPETGIRISSLRGAMRYWLRAIAGAEVGEQIGLLAAVESRVFGSTMRASPVALRLPNPPEARLGRPAWSGGDKGRWIGYLAGQGLSKPAGGNRGILVTRRFIDPGGPPFRLQLRFGADTDAAALALAALWCLCRYGGLGARTRRGFGGLRITAVEGELPAPWTPEMLCSATVVPSAGLQLDEHGRPPELATCAESLERLVALARQDLTTPPAAFDGWHGLPTYPVFGGPEVFIAGLSSRTFADWSAVLAYAGEQFRSFRATESAPGAKYTPKIKTREWLHTVNGTDHEFALGALGLPVVFKDGKTVYPVGAAGGGGSPLRRASPLWLRPVRDSDDKWRLLSFAFLGRFLPPEVDVVLSQPMRPLVVGSADVKRLSTDWITTLSSSDGSFIRSETP
ncbi:type III-B CRISPR module RAMP protein Cmr1 [Micromonospora gifhornensis]|uniref:CRISPR type III-associated protein domain-containing protein n=1 Tax=Micromonospora gifhornensis TaxID=84594 RepID=A0ABQ4IMP9_9ACTN|nr:type III-B CRISPR module RAMP protein Cmr1 [Micromonospora gifhornensis]GIJ19185.1 hypothetical protein Vgi01_58690 [Micromonospora gifhornensis]